MTSHHPVEKVWWKEAVIYQIYPASFCDSDGDGLGDIPGIVSKVPYIQSLGVDTIWLSPIFASPQNDMGYDISDYRSIHPPYGTVEDVQQLIEDLHSRDMRLLMDLVVNHTSDEHAWFTKSRSSRTSSKRDWYFWRDPKYDDQGQRKEPNNWKSIFGGSAWHFDETTEQYYLALFLPSQPDLNWENRDMKTAAYDDMRFWLDRGVDGFRIDSMNLMSKHPDLPDAKVVTKEPYQDGSEWFASGPRMHDYIQEMRAEVFDNYESIMTVGELGAFKDEGDVADYVAKDRRELNMVFTGDIVNLDFGPTKYDRDDFHPTKIRCVTDRWQTMMPKFNAWNSVYLDNHDSGRSLTRYASDAPEYRDMAAKMLATYLLTLAGTPFMLSGQEIGMANLGKDYGKDAYIDLEGNNFYNKVLKSRDDDESQMGDVLRELQLKARDHGRLPMQWSDAPNAGFTAAASTPWMTINKDYKEWNVSSQEYNPKSILSYWKRMLEFRKTHADNLVYGQYEPIPESEIGEVVLGYRMRCHETGKTLTVLLNFSNQEQTAFGKEFDEEHVLVTNQESARGAENAILLAPFGAVVLGDP